MRFADRADLRLQIVRCILAIINAVKFIVPFWLVKNGVEFIISNATARQISALAKLIEAFLDKFNLPFYALLTICAGVLCPVIVIQRWRIARLTRELSTAREEIEANDPQRSSSGLTREGKTPKGR